MPISKKIAEQIIKEISDYIEAHQKHRSWTMTARVIDKNVDSFTISFMAPAREPDRRPESLEDIKRHPERSLPDEYKDAAENMDPNLIGKVFDRFDGVSISKDRKRNYNIPSDLYAHIEKIFKRYNVPIACLNTQMVAQKFR